MTNPFRDEIVSAELANPYRTPDSPSPPATPRRRFPLTAAAAWVFLGPIIAPLVGRSIGWRLSDDGQMYFFLAWYVPCAVAWLVCLVRLLVWPIVG
jgi:hypothetical protein